MFVPQRLSRLDLLSARNNLRSRVCSTFSAVLRRQGDDAAPTRVMVFAPTSEAAQACASPIRNVLWGDHKVAVLLPKGEEPIKVVYLAISV